MPRTHRSRLPLLVASASLLALLAAVLLLLEDPGPRPPGRPSPVARDRPGAGRRASSGSDLPAASLPPQVAADHAPRERVTPPPRPRRGPRRLVAQVYDGDNAKPVQNFQVTVLPAAAKDPLKRLGEVPPRPFHERDGIFAINLEPGSYDVLVQAPGFLPGNLRGVAIPAENGEALPLALHRGAGIDGLLLGHEGLARPGLPVFLETLRLANPADEPPAVTITTSGVDGGFSFSPLPDGEYAVTALEPENQQDRIAGIRVYGNATKVRLILAARHQVSFRVQDLRGLPVGEAMLELSGDGRFESARSNESGVISLDNLPDGDYSVHVVCAGYAELKQPLKLQGGQGQHVQWLTLVPAPEDEPPR